MIALLKEKWQENLVERKTLKRKTKNKFFSYFEILPF